MIMPSPKVFAVLLAASALCVDLLCVSTARAEDPKDKSLTEQAREGAQKGVRELKEAQRSARDELKQAEQNVRDAERQLKDAAADAKEAAAKALSEAKEALERAKREVHAGAHAATDEATGKAAELKADVAEAAVKARDKAEGAAEEAAAGAMTTVRNIEAKAHQIMQTAVGATGENARRRHARRMAWRQLSNQVERPQDVPPGVREELRRHAQRLARLQRIRTLANEKKEPALVARTDALIAREEQRHTKKLAVLWSAMHAQGGANRAKTSEEEDQDPREEQAEEEEEQQ